MNERVRFSKIISIMLFIIILTGCSSPKSQGNLLMNSLAEYFSGFGTEGVKYDADGKSNLKFCEENGMKGICYQYKFSTLGKDSYEIVQIEYINKSLYEDTILTIAYPDRTIDYQNADDEQKTQMDALNKSFEEHLKEKELSWNHLDELITQLRILYSQDE